MKGIITKILTVVLVACAFVLASCNGSKETKIGVIRSDATSAEAKAFEAYLTEMSEAFGYSIDFTYTENASKEKEAIQTYASKGYKGIFSISGSDIISQVSECEKNKMWYVRVTTHAKDSEIETLNGYNYYLGSVGPTNETQANAGYNMAKHYIDSGVKAFGIFGGAIAFGDDMHIYRAAGMIKAMLETKDGATYDGETTIDGIASSIRESSNVDATKLVGSECKITGFQASFSWGDQAFLTGFNTMLDQTVTANGVVLCVGAGDTVTSMLNGRDLKVAGVDAIDSNYLQYFDQGYDYDCGKFISSLAPSFTLMVKALNGNKLVDADGNAPYLVKDFWVATSKAELQELIDSDKPGNYVFGKGVIDHYVEADYEAFVEWTQHMSFEDAKEIGELYNK